MKKILTAALFISIFCVTVDAQPTLFIGNDTTICGNGLTLNATTTNFSATTTYVNQLIPFAPVAPGGTAITLSDDQWSQAINIGFNFCFYGNTYTQCLIGSNGVITFNLSGASTTPGGYCQWPISYAIPSPNLPTPSIMISFQDLYASMGGTIKHQVYGQSPHRRFVVSFDSVAYFSCTSQFFTGQMILYEENSNIEIHIHNKSICSSWNGGAAILGIQDSAGTNAYWAPNHNYPTLWSDTDVAYLFHPDSVYAPNQTNMNRISGKIFIDFNHFSAFGLLDGCKV